MVAADFCGRRGGRFLRSPCFPRAFASVRAFMPVHRASTMPGCGPVSVRAAVGVYQAVRTAMGNTGGADSTRRYQ